MNPASLSEAQARRVLANCSHADPALVREGLLLLSGPADYRLIGVLADSFAEGLAALRSYIAAFGYPEPPLPAPVAADPGVYLKYNPRSGNCYASTYMGKERGVIVSCFSPGRETDNETFAYLPLNLFALPQD